MTSTISNIDNLIRNHNPFAGHTVVRPPQIWAKSFPDVPSINAHASNAVLEAVKQVRQGQRQVVGITITAEKGLGKSQIISRIRHRLQVETGALFIYMSKYDNLNQIKYQFLQTVVSSLRAFGSYQGVMQWQELAATLINEGKKWNYTPQQYISLFPSWLSKHSNKVVEHFTDCILQIKPHINNPYIVKAILWTLSSAHAIYATHWLSGFELTQTQAETMVLPNPKREDKEAEALSTIRQILDITSDYRVPVICFDELDIADADDNGFTAAQVIANLTKDLYNNLERGVLLLAMYPETWRDQVKTLPQAEAVIDRLVSEQRDRQPITLNYLNSDDVLAIVFYWLKDFYEENQLNPPHPFYPFDENKLRDLGKGKPTIRAVLKWCAEHFVVSISDDDTGKDNTGSGNGGSGTTRDTHPVEPYFETELANIEGDIDVLSEENNDAIADALLLALRTIKKQTLEGVTIHEIEEIQASSADKGYIHFKVVGKENKKAVKIGVAVLQQSGGKYQGAALKRLTDYEKFDLTRGCLVRSKKINPGAKAARDGVRKLLSQKGGEWVLLQAQDIKPLLAILFVHDNRESYELSEEQIIDFIQHKRLAIDNPLIREILSDPSGQEPENLFDEDMPVSIPQTVSDSVDNIELNI
ncbi:hypothetical protein [Allocoleopsis franciscana]|uniref:Orc1-like AAA ATPase domain-containing protein n=1 Tax=Allocoleopsis franciscana PCC 7113 TaxID=1173027 RepID=K9W8S8_9CYAN|nr:hypothetical protein [Allocoleopsis franciscana]AFZ16211.1 hypothetical protein Mic7113_0281 [Allocoleopsis franciscana PCC 7113]